jgi:hypothetical protein
MATPVDQQPETIDTCLALVQNLLDWTEQAENKLNAIHADTYDLADRVNTSLVMSVIASILIAVILFIILLAQFR